MENRKHNISIDFVLTEKQIQILGLISSGEVCKYDTIMSKERYIQHSTCFGDWTEKEIEELGKKYDELNWKYATPDEILELEELGLLMLDPTEYRGPWILSFVGKKIAEKIKNAGIYKIIE